LNFLPDSDSNISFIQTSLDVLRDECPLAYQTMCRLMTGQSVTLTIGVETMLLVFSQEHVEVTPSDQQDTSHLHLDASEQTILALADGHTNILDALVSGLLELKGPLPDIALVYETLIVYLSGAVRCPSFPSLLDDFRYVQAQR
jgi:hypothetical protein